MSQLKYWSDYVELPYTKRYVQFRKVGLRETLRRVRRICRPMKQRPIFFKLRQQLEMNSGPRMPFSAERQNFNTHYRQMQVRLPKRK